MGSQECDSPQAFDVNEAHTLFSRPPLDFKRMRQRWAWGDPPVGFKNLSPDPMQMIVVREGLEKHLDVERFLALIESVAQRSPFQGRERLRFFDLNNGETALVRAYHHGGMLRHLTRHIYFTWPPRPFRELALTEEVRRRGVPTLEVLGAWVERVWGLFYRGWLLSRELKGGQDLWAALRSERYVGPASKSLLQAVARGLRTMHRRGVYHGDLNLKNILVRQETDEIKSYIIDFDKASLYLGAVPVNKAEKNLRRLYRSACKLDPQKRWFPQKDWDLLVRLYAEAEER